MDKQGYRSRFYLRSFFVRHSGGDLRQAVTLLQQAREVRKYMRRVIADLALCYQKLGRWADLEGLLRSEAQRVNENPMLLDLKIGILIAHNDFDEAEKAMRQLRAMQYEDGRAESRRAMILMKRDSNYKGAAALLTELLRRRTGGQTAVRRLRAIAAAHAKDFETARSDAQILRTRPGGPDMARRIEARIKLVQNDYDGALGELTHLRSRTVQDRLLEARILDAKSNDPSTPIHQRESLRDRAAEMRAQNRMIDEFETDR